MKRKPYRGSTYTLDFEQGSRGPLHVVPVIWDQEQQLIHQREDYTVAEVRQVIDWLNGCDQPLPPYNQSEADDPLLGQHRRA